MNSHAFFFSLLLTYYFYYRHCHLPSPWRTRQSVLTSLRIRSFVFLSSLVSVSVFQSQFRSSSVTAATFFRFLHRFPFISSNETDFSITLRPRGAGVKASVMMELTGTRTGQSGTGTRGRVTQGHWEKAGVLIGSVGFFFLHRLGGRGGREGWDMGRWVGSCSYCR